LFSGGAFLTSEQIEKIIKVPNATQFDKISSELIVVSQRDGNVTIVNKKG
jgi:hypothetical protein